MWWLDAADSRMSVAKSHGEEMRAEAEASRLASSTPCPGEVQIAVSGRHLHVGSLVIVIGRTLREEHCAESVRA